MANTPNLAGWTLTFDDEFDSFPSQSQASTTWQKVLWSPNGEYDTASQTAALAQAGAKYPFSDQNGELSITASPESNGTYMTGEIRTQDTFTQTYGYYEMRAEMPQGAGLWPAFFLGPASNIWPPELDVVEAFGATAPDGEGGSNIYHYNVHSAINGQSGAWTSPLGANIYTGYHTYGMDWEKDYTTFYFDGVQVGKVATPADLDQPMWLDVSLAAGSQGDWPGPATGETGTMKVDYVRVYSNAAGATAVPLQTVSSPDGAATNFYGASVGQTTTTPTAPTDPAPPTTPTPPAPTVDTLSIGLSEDAFKGDAQFQVFVDNKQVGGTYTANALHSASISEDLVLTGHWGTGAQSVKIAFINDASASGANGGDRNLYVNTISYDGVTDAKTSAALTKNGSDTFAVGGATKTAAAPATQLVLHLSEDAYKGDAQFQLSIDGKVVTTAQSVTASHAAGATQSFTFTGQLAAGTHDVGVTFLNDAYGGSAATDRNLYVGSLSFDGHQSTGAALLSDGTAHFSVTS